MSLLYNPFINDIFFLLEVIPARGMIPIHGIKSKPPSTTWSAPIDKCLCRHQTEATKTTCDDGDANIILNFLQRDVKLSITHDVTFAHTQSPHKPSLTTVSYLHLYNGIIIILRYRCTSHFLLSNGASTTSSCHTYLHALFVVISCSVSMETIDNTRVSITNVADWTIPHTLPPTNEHVSSLLPHFTKLFGKITISKMKSTRIVCMRRKDKKRSKERTDRMVSIIFGHAMLRSVNLAHTTLSSFLKRVYWNS